MFFIRRNAQIVVTKFLTLRRLYGRIVVFEAHLYGRYEFYVYRILSQNSPDFVLDFACFSGKTVKLPRHEILISTNYSIFKVEPEKGPFSPEKLFIQVKRVHHELCRFT